MKKTGVALAILLAGLSAQAALPRVVDEVRRQIGTVAAPYGYSSFGRLLYQTNTPAQPFRFSTRLYHERSGLLYLVGRWYDPNTGRFLSRDPIREAGGINLYRAFAGNPVNFADPDGRSPILVAALAVAAWTWFSSADYANAPTLEQPQYASKGPGPAVVETVAGFGGGAVLGKAIGAVGSRCASRSNPNLEGAAGPARQPHLCDAGTGRV